MQLHKATIFRLLLIYIRSYYKIHLRKIILEWLLRQCLRYKWVPCFCCWYLLRGWRVVDWFFQLAIHSKRPYKNSEECITFSPAPSVKSIWSGCKIVLGSVNVPEHTTIKSKSSVYVYTSFSVFHFCHEESKKDPISTQVCHRFFPLCWGPLYQSEISWQSHVFQRTFPNRTKLGSQIAIQDTYADSGIGKSVNQSIERSFGACVLTPWYDRLGAHPNATDCVRALTSNYIMPLRWEGLCCRKARDPRATNYANLFLDCDV